MPTHSFRTWSGDPSGRVALLRGNHPAPSVIAQIVAAGHTSVRSGALAAEEARPFLERGWEVAGRLHLLRHPLEHPPARPELRLRRFGRRAAGRLEALDDIAFPAEWRLGEVGLVEALRSTPAVRGRMAIRNGQPAGFAISGISRGRGYLQRLAVAEGLRREGLGRALTLDALRWMRRKGATEALVNTYEGNEAALALYRSLGFRDVEPGLVVLSIDL